LRILDLRRTDCLLTARRSLFLDAGGEVDLDLDLDLDPGNYERYLSITLNRYNSFATGRIYQYVIEPERRGNYLGKTMQVVPHLTNALTRLEMEKVKTTLVVDTNETPGVCIIVELGVAVGDIESELFIEAMSLEGTSWEGKLSTDPSSLVLVEAENFAYCGYGFLFSEKNREAQSLSIVLASNL
jgi:hypothetical protein